VEGFRTTHQTFGRQQFTRSYGGPPPSETIQEGRDIVLKFKFRLSVERKNSANGWVEIGKGLLNFDLASESGGRNINQDTCQIAKDLRCVIPAAKIEESQQAEKA
jgi:hypothetical protein